MINFKGNHFEREIILWAAQPLTGTRRAALLGTCARARATRRHAPSVVSH